MIRKSQFLLLLIVAFTLPSVGIAHPLTFSSEMSYSDGEPAAGGASLVNWSGAAFDAANIGGSGVNADGGGDNGAANDSTTYVANNQPIQGQTFTTGANEHGYELTSVTARMAGYTDNNAAGSNRTSWNLNATNGPIIVTIGRISGTEHTTISMQNFMAGGTGNPGAGTSANGSGTYITFHLPFPVHLEPNATYSFDFSIGNAGSNFFEWLGTSEDAFENGEAFTRSWRTITPLAGDRVFQVNLTPRTTPHTPFLHPGALHTEADLDRMAAKVAAGAQPWKQSYDILADSPWAQTWWPPYDVDHIIRGASGNNYTRSQQDAQAIYELALRWKITGDTDYADKAVEIANVWSDLEGLIGNSNRSLAAGICGYLFASGGEILSTYAGWPESEKQAYKRMMMRVFYPENFDFLWRKHDTFWREGGNTHYRLNWESANMASMAAIGILCDNRAVYEQALDFFKYGAGNGRVERAAWYVHPGGLAQGEEAGRDQGHNMIGWYQMALLCQMAWNQGDDLYGYDNNRMLRVFEYNAKYNLGFDVPYARHRNSALSYTEGSVSPVTRGAFASTYEQVYNHYVNVKGLAAPYSEMAAAAIRPEPRPDPGIHPSQVDWFGLGTLTFTRDPIASDRAPTGLTAHWSKNRIVLNWWGSARATRYLVKRGESAAGPFQQIGEVTGPDLNFVDTEVVNGATYFYIVTAVTPTGNLDSAPLEVAQKLVTHYTFEGNANDVVGTRDATFLGGMTAPGFATGVDGVRSRAVSLNGAHQYVQLPVGSANYQDITIAAWIYWNGGGAWQRVFDFGSEMEKTMFLTPASGGGGIEFGMTTTRGGNFEGDASYYLRGPVLPTDEWIHVAVTLRGDVGTLYIDGEAVDTKVIDLIDPLFGQPYCYLGRSMYNADPYFQGRIDDFRIYNYGLRGSAIHALAGNGSNAAPVFSSDPVSLATAVESDDYSAADISLADYVVDAEGDAVVFSKLAGPAWLQVAPDGALSGVPGNDDVGLNAFAVRVSDSAGATDDAVIRIHVVNTNGAPVWTVPALTKPAAARGRPYAGFDVAHAADDPDLSYGDKLTFTKETGPAWLTVSGDGALSGTPDVEDVGINAFTVRVTDAAGAFAEIGLQVEVVLSQLGAHYPFDGNADDRVGARNGSPAGRIGYGAGYVGEAVSLSGSGEYVMLPEGIVSGLEEFTISVWVKPETFSTWARVFDFGTGTDNYMFLTIQHTGDSPDAAKPRFAIRTPTVGEQVVSSSIPLTADAWNHIGITLLGDTAKMYINGAVAGANADVTLRPSSLGATTQNYIGKSQWNDPYFDGWIDDFRIYGRAMNPQEMASFVTPLETAGELATPSLSIVAPEGQEEPAVQLTKIPTVAGFSYQLQTSADLSGGSWIDLGDPIFGDGALQRFTAPFDPQRPRAFFRIRITR